MRQTDCCYTNIIGGNNSSFSHGEMGGGGGAFFFDILLSSCPENTKIFILGCFVMNHKTILLTCTVRFILSTLSRQSHVACSYLKMGYFLDYFHLVVVGFP